MPPRPQLRRDDGTTVYRYQYNPTPLTVGPQPEATRRLGIDQTAVNRLVRKTRTAAAPEVR
ncbi:hypothetical protein ACFU98_44110 [Streptomyces sp. NPDC057575]|uniref:hypothetical protein n=1 Tax=unclassified Streptomyces TaxID=2593676 RepID=UPI0036B5FD91